MSGAQAVTSGNLHERLIGAIVDYAIYMLSPDGAVASWNAGAAAIKGYSEAEILGRHFSVFYTPEDRAAGRPEQALKIAAAKGRFAAEAWRCRKDGTRFWAMVVIDAIRQDGVLVGFAKITRDMTEQHAAQVAALESERRFRLLVESVTDYAICMLDTEGRVANWNRGAERITGYRAAEIVGRHFSVFYTPEDQAAGRPAAALKAARGDGRYAIEAWRCRKDGTRFWASVVLDPIYDNNILVGFAKITRDLTERREAQRQLEDSRQQLFQAQKMEAVGQLTGGLAHDFNNLLTGLVGSLTMIETRLQAGRTDGLQRYVAAAQETAGRATALTHRLLAFARRQALDTKVTDVNALIRSLEDLVRRTAGDSIGLDTALAEDAWPVLCDPNQLESAVLNLCINARDAMPEGGTITISTANIALDEPPVANFSVRAGDYLTVTVRDDGHGMTPDVVARAFDPFFTTKPQGQGVGLGLSMIHGFVEQSGGRVEVTSAPGAGTTVTLYLPRYMGEAQAPAAEDETAEPAPRGGVVLVVDDEAAIRMLIVDVLQEQGYICLEAGDTATALAIMRSSPMIDLLITDIGLPGGGSGRQVAEAARARWPGLKVLFISGYADAEAMTNHLDAGMRVLAKPFMLDVLTNQVNALRA